MNRRINHAGHRLTFHNESRTGFSGPCFVDSFALVRSSIRQFERRNFQSAGVVAERNFIVRSTCDLRPIMVPRDCER